MPATTLDYTGMTKLHSSFPHSLQFRQVKRQFKQYVQMTRAGNIRTGISREDFLEEVTSKLKLKYEEGLARHGQTSTGMEDRHYWTHARNQKFSDWAEGETLW